MLEPMPPPRRSRRATFILLVLLAVPVFFGVSLSRFLHTYGRYHDRALLESGQIPVPRIDREAIVVLTGDHGRIPDALKLLQERGSSLLVISGTGKGTSLTDLVNQQVGAIFHIKDTWEKIVLDSNSSSTIENAERTAPILARRGIQRIILVTSDYHMGRALAIFHQVMPEMEIYDYSVPSGSRFDLSWKFWVEFWKTFFYHNFSSRSVGPYQGDPGGKAVE